MLSRLERGKTLSEKAHELLLEEIRGMTPGNNKLMSEEDLADEFGISRATVREAVKYLMMEAVVTRVQGKGIFAHPSVLNVENRVDLRSDFYSMLTNSYGQVTLDIEHLGICPPSEICLQYLTVPSEVFTMRWTYKAQGINRIHGQFEFPVEFLKTPPPKGFWVSGLPEFGRKYLYAPIAYCPMYIKCGFDARASEVFHVDEKLPMQCWQERIIDLNDNAVGFCQFFLHPTEMQTSVVTTFHVT